MFLRTLEVVKEKYKRMSSIFRKKFHRQEKIVRGFSNHRRIEILYLLHKQPELSLMEIADTLGIHFKTASEHTLRLAIAGLIIKRPDGFCVRHALTERGHAVLVFLRTLE